MNKPTVFLDRDGTINVDKGYVHKVDDWVWIPGAIEAIAALKKAGFLVIVITNQAGIARGYYDEADMNNLHMKINEKLKSHGAEIDKFYHCPHHPEFGEVRNCKCRKPMKGMLNMACNDYNIDLAKSWLIGDKASDIQAGLQAGVKSILVMTGYGKNDCALLGNEQNCVADLLEASKYILAHQ